MKKLLTIFLVAMLCFATMFSFAACGNNDNSDASKSSETSSSAEASSSSAAGTSSSAAASSSKSVRVPETIVPATEKHLGTADGSTPITIFMVGDSTVCNYPAEPGRKYPRNGYGMRLGEYLNANVTIKNLAISGRSSKSFLSEDNYVTLKNELKAGDYLIIDFGHNDEKQDSVRYTNPAGYIDEEGSFKKTLNDNYIKLALEKGATPILCTPIVRRSATGNYNGERAHITKTEVEGGVEYEGGDYAQAVRDLGTQTGVTVLDLTARTKEYLTPLSAEESLKYYSIEYIAEKNTEGEIVHNGKTKEDNTHINAYGAQLVAKMVAEELKKSENSLKNYVLDVLPEPNPAVAVENPVPVIGK